MTAQIISMENYRERKRREQRAPRPKLPDPLLKHTWNMTYPVYRKVILKDAWTLPYEKIEGPVPPIATNVLIMIRPNFTSGETDGPAKT